MHDLPLTAFEANKPWQAHQTEALTSDLCGPLRTTHCLLFLHQLGKARRQCLRLRWAPGKLAELTGLNVEVKAVRETLVKRFQQ